MQFGKNKKANPKIGLNVCCDWRARNDESWHYTVELSLAEVLSVT